jgi:hypothetical protein
MDAKLEIAEVNTGQRCHVICQRFLVLQLLGTIELTPMRLSKVPKLL